MTESVDKSHDVAHLALASLKELGLASNPRNYEVWYTHIDGRNPALSRDIQKCLGRIGEITQADVDALYSQHIVRVDLAHDVLEVVSRFEHEVIELSELIEASGESAHGRGIELQELSLKLHESTQEYPSVSALLESVLAITKSVRQENQKLERRLAESSDEVAALRRNVEHIQQEAMTDPLTGVRNRKSFDTMIVNLIENAKKTNEPLALVVADIDHFKKFNDQWGHQTGDHVLRLVAEVMSANLKGADLLARYGGEEFVMLLPGTSIEHAAMLADRIRGVVQSRRLKKRRTNEDLGVITVSMGVAKYEPGDTPETLVERADQRLYAAKNNGRNQVVSEPCPDDPVRTAAQRH
ncbi:MAG: GGDEF domain-containing protein [Parvularculaceae bacterium]|nr:GGDEF domain-containing protein [Caulobacterales bacterium]HRX37791.1 GGDEF domain-containing protein [Parvularculaceae bacterium]